MNASTRLMAARVTSGFTMLLLLPLTGCIQMEHELKINENGSAVYDLNYAITEQAIAQFQAMLKLKDELAVAAGEATPPGTELEPLLAAFLSPDEAEIRKQIEALGIRGLSIKTIGQAARTAWRHIDLELEIADLAELAKNPFFIKHGFDLYKNAEGQQVWSRAPHINDPGSIPDTLSDRDLEQITPLLAGFKTVVKITLPGRIVSTTAFRTSLHTAIWEFDFNRQPTAIQALQRQPFQVVFDAPQASLPELRTSSKDGLSQR